MAKFTVSTTELRSKASDLETMCNKLNTEVTKLRDANTVLASKWEGPAKAKFNEEFQKDAEKFDLFKNGVMTFVQQLRTDADEYDKEENKNLGIAQTRKA